MMKRKTCGVFVLDSRKRCVSDGVRETALQYKVWRVLTALIDAAPGTATRAALIEDIWRGNYATGEKALNQALWTIRAALGDDAKAPRYIATVPREGYRWIGPVPEACGGGVEAARNAAGRRMPAWRSLIAAAALSAFGVLAAGVYGYVSFAFAPSVRPSDGAVRQDALAHAPASGARAYFQDRDIIVEFEGARLVIKPRGGKRFGSPLFSDDGKRIAFHVDEPEGCKLVMLNLETLDRIDFGSCSSFEPVRRQGWRRA